MRLNPDCIRDILRTVEENTDGITPFTYDKDGEGYPYLEAYDHAEIVYHIKQCGMADLITGYRFFDMGETILISDLGPNGHEFLANTRKESVWQKTKEVAANIGSSSLGALLQIATSVVSELITGRFSG